MPIIYQFIWNNIQVKIRLTVDDVPGYRRVYGKAMNHLEIICDEPLPMTNTGYKSHFIEDDLLVHLGGAIAYVTEWLEDESKSAEWQSYFVNRQQLSLF